MGDSISNNYFLIVSLLLRNMIIKVENFYLERGVSSIGRIKAVKWTVERC